MHSTNPALNEQFFNKRFTRLKRFVDSIEHHIGIEKLRRQFVVRVVNQDFIPTESFFTMAKSKAGKPYSIFYLPNRINLAKPAKCLTSNSHEFQDVLHNEFDQYWEIGQELSVDSLLDLRKAGNFELARYY